MDGYTLEGCQYPLPPPSFPPFSSFSFSPFLFHFSPFFRQSPNETSERGRERESCSSGTQSITMALLEQESIGHPVESHSRMCLRTRGLGFLSKLKTNSSHLCHRWHNNHLCLLLLLLLSLVLPSLFPFSNRLDFICLFICYFPLLSAHSSRGFLLLLKSSINKAAEVSLFFYIRYIVSLD